jgi:hypothetical protein
MPVNLVSYKREIGGLLFGNYFSRAVWQKEVSVITKANFHFRVVIPKEETGLDSLCFVFYPGLELVNHKKAVLKEEWMYSELSEIDFRTELDLPAAASWQIVGTAEIEAEYDKEEQTFDSVIKFLDYEISQINDLTLNRYLPDSNREISVNNDERPEKA